MKFYHPPFTDPNTPGCDIEFCEFFNSVLRDFESRPVVLHYGTGAHHIVAKTICDSAWVIGLTKCLEEHEEYGSLLKERPELLPNYLCLLTDIYAFNPFMYPEFDVITLFHLCEYRHDSADSGYPILTDRDLLDHLIGASHPQAMFVFFAHSNGWKRTKLLLESTELIHTANFKRLKIYRKDRSENPAPR